VCTLTYTYAWSPTHIDTHACARTRIRTQQTEAEHAIIASATSELALIGEELAKYGATEISPEVGSVCVLFANVCVSVRVCVWWGGTKASVCVQSSRARM
jgi:hypothetical protein